MRYFGLDLARAIFMILSVFYHAAGIFCEGWRWRLKYPEPHQFFDYVAYVLHLFRMPGFYILSGFFFLMVYQKYGFRKTISSRAVRLLVPLFFTGFTINTLMNILYPSTKYHTDILLYIWDGQWLHQLWFIGNLFIYSLMALPIAALLTNLRPPSVNKHIFMILIFLFCSASAAALEHYGGMKISGNILFLSFPRFFFYLPFFLTGMLFYWKRSVFFSCLKLNISGSYMVGVTILIFLFNKSGLASSSFLAYETVETLLKLSMAFMLTSILNSLGKESLLLERLVDASYTVYLVHMLMFVILFPLILILPINIFVLYLLSVALVYYYCIIFHEKFVRKFKTLYFFLNGKTLKPDIKPSRSEIPN